MMTLPETILDFGSKFQLRVLKTFFSLLKLISFCRKRVRNNLNSRASGALGMSREWKIPGDMKLPTSIRFFVHVSTFSKFLTQSSTPITFKSSSLDFTHVSYTPECSKTITRAHVHFVLTSLCVDEIHTTTCSAQVNFVAIQLWKWDPSAVP